MKNCFTSLLFNMYIALKDKSEFSEGKIILCGFESFSEQMKKHLKENQRIDILLYGNYYS